MKMIVARDHRYCFEFRFPSLDTRVRLENSDMGPVVRATRDTFSESRKISFIHELAAEGFIDERYQRLARSEAPSLRWLIDDSWMRSDQIARARTHRFMVRLIGGAALLWLALIVALLVSG